MPIAVNYSKQGSLLILAPSQDFLFREEVKNCKERIQNLEKKRDETYGEIEKAQDNDNM